MQIIGTIFLVLCAFGLAVVVGGCGRGTAENRVGVNAVHPEVAAAPVQAGLVVFDSERDSFKEWRMYSRDGIAAGKVSWKIPQPADPALVVLQSISGSPVGTNMILEGLRGEVSLEYKVVEAGADAKFGIIVIPIKTMTEKGPIEVGSEAPERAGESKNIDSKYRTRMMLPAEHNDGQWHSGVLKFDFTAMKEATFSILAPRVNEFPGAGSPGKIMFRNAKVTLR